MVSGEVPGFIRRGDLSRDRSEQRPDRFAAGEVVDALVTTVDKTSRKVNLSIKAREVHDEKIAMAEFGSSNSGASLGDILGAALKERSSSLGDEPEELAGSDSEKTPPVKTKAPAKKKAATAKEEVAPKKKVVAKQGGDE